MKLIGVFVDQFFFIFRTSCCLDFIDKMFTITKNKKNMKKQKRILERILAGIIIFAAIVSFFAINILYVVKDLIITIALALMACLRVLFSWLVLIRKKQKKSR